MLAGGLAERTPPSAELGCCSCAGWFGLGLCAWFNLALLCFRAAGSALINVQLQRLLVVLGVASTSSAGYVR